jgi:hypothetical protein
MANDKEKEVSTQIRWNLLGRILTASVPFAEGEININIDEVHESWNDYIKVYGICQSTKDEIASASYSNPELRVKIAAAKAAKNEELEKTLKDEYKALRVEYLKMEAANIRTALWNSVNALKDQKPAKKEGAAKETKAQVESRVKAELKAKAIAAGMTEEMANVVFA